MKRTDSLITWFGELTTRQQLLKRGSLLLMPGMLWLMLFLVLPSLVLVVVSVVTRGAYGQLEWTFTLENYKRLAGFTLFGWTPDYLMILWRSVVVAFFTTLVSVILSYPLCFFIAGRPRTKSLHVADPGHHPILDQHGHPGLCLVSDPVARDALCPAGGGFRLYPGRRSAIPQRLCRLSGHGVHVFALCHPAAVRQRGAAGLVAGRSGPGSVCLTIADIYPGHFAADHAGSVGGDHPHLRSRHGHVRCPRPVGRGQVYAGGNLIQQQFGSSRDWPFGAAISMGLMVLTMIGLQIYRRHGKEIEVI